MKRIILLLLIFSFTSSVTHAQWYENSSDKNWTTSSKQTNCGTDGDDGHDGGDGLRIADNNSSTALVEEGSAIVDFAHTGTLRCLHWDATDPVRLSNVLEFMDDWVNEDQVVTVNNQDDGGSGLSNITLYQSLDDGATWTSIATWNITGNPNDTLVTHQQTRSVAGQHGNIYQYRVVATDVAGNVTDISDDPKKLRIDLEAPEILTPVYTLPDGSIYTPGTWSNQDVTVTITCKDDESGCDMAFANAGWTVDGNTYTQTFTGNTDDTGISGSIQLKDNAGSGNFQTINFGAIKMDFTTPTAPVIVPEEGEHTHPTDPNQTRDDDEWSNDPTVDLEIFDDIDPTDPVTTVTDCTHGGGDSDNCDAHDHSITGDHTHTTQVISGYCTHSGGDSDICDAHDHLNSADDDHAHPQYTQITCTHGGVNTGNMCDGEHNGGGDVEHNHLPEAEHTHTDTTSTPGSGPYPSPRTTYYCLDNNSPYTCDPTDTGATDSFINGTVLDPNRANLDNDLTDLPDGVYHLRMQTCTEGGTCSEPESIYIIKIDTIDPVITTTYTNADGSVYTPDTWTNQAVTVRMQCYDETSGCDSYNIPAGWEIEAGTENANGFTLIRTYTDTTPPEGISGGNEFWDIAGNNFVENFGPIKIDLTTPEDPIIIPESGDDYDHPNDPNNNDTRDSGEWTNDNDFDLTIDDDTVAQPSPRTTYFCVTANIGGNTEPTECDPTDPSQRVVAENGDDPNSSTSIPGTVNIPGYGNVDISNLPDGVYTFMITTCTESENCTGPQKFVVKIDTTLPSPEDLISSLHPSYDYDSDTNTFTSNVAQLLANDSYTLDISIDENNGSPITSIESLFENWNSQNTRDLSYTSDNAGFAPDINICNIDNHPSDMDSSTCNVTNSDGASREANGGRTYTLEINEICDQAGNCMSTSALTALLDYEIYANTTNMTSDIDHDPISSSGYADGEEKRVSVTLEDSFGNAIVDASGIGRAVSFNMDIENNLRLDQYTNDPENSNESAIYIGSQEIAIGPVNYAGGSLPGFYEEIGTDDHIIPFRIYSPTNSAYSHVPGNATIQRISYNITASTSIETGDTIMDAPVVTGVSLDLQPLYESLFSGRIVNPGFIEGTTQSSDISLTKTTPIGDPTIETNRELYLEFGGPYTANFNMSAQGGNISGTTTVSENQTLSTLLKNDGGYEGSHDIDTYIYATGTVASLSEAYLASIIKYNINGLDVVYPGDTVNKTTYHSGDTLGAVVQVAARIIGNTTSQKTQEIVDDQFSDDVRILGKLTKSLARRDIERKVYTVIRNIQAKTTGSTTLSNSDLNNELWNVNNSARGLELYGSSILYYGGLGGDNVRIDGASNLEGKKTLIVEDGDVYIAGNIVDTDSDGILGIVALNGNILIDTEVTDLHAILYTNKSIMSTTNGNDELDGTANINDLANQLYIYGSLFSENTVGGSRKATPECPYYIDESSCGGASDAQKYDLNYLRRYYRYDPDGDPLTADETVANGGADAQGGYLSGKGDFPVIIEYNPRVQQTPPPMFD